MSTNTSVLDAVGDAVGYAAAYVSEKIFGPTHTLVERRNNHPYDSFAPVRNNVHIKFYVDGKDYFYAVSEALSHAKHEIFIEDWWLSPELYLRRPHSKAESEQYRLDLLLARKAAEGVKIYVVVYKEMELALTLNSAHSKAVLQNAHPNIKVQRHPDHQGPEGTYFWAHHEKLVVIDRHTAFIGGLDLCFGRYDTHKHQLADFHEVSDNVEVWPGQDYSNPRIKDFAEVQKWRKSLIDKKELARMPWHDVSIGFVGRPALDVARHFIERWNFIKKEKAENREIYPVLIAKSDRQTDRENPPSKKRYVYFDTPCEVDPTGGANIVQILRSSCEWSHGLKTSEHSIMNAYIECIRNAKHFIYIENQFFVTATFLNDKFPVKNLIGKELVERIKKAHQNNENFRIIVNMPLFPSFPAEIDSNDAGTVRLVCHYQYASISRGGESIFDELRKVNIDPEKYIGFYALRSWDQINKTAVDEGRGLLPPEEGQASTWHSGPEKAIPKTIPMHDETGSFVTEELYIHTKVMIVDDQIVICGSANLNDRSQLGTHDSEIAAIIKDTEFTDSKMAGKPWKAGKFAGSLRRFLFREHLGYIKGNEYKDHDCVNKNCYPAPFPQEPKIITHHETDKIVEDPVDPEFYEKVWAATAKKNTEIYRDVFHCVPDDTVTTWEEYNKFIPDRSKKIPTGHVCDPERPVEQVRAKLNQIQGHLVQFPTKFLEGVELSGTIKENIISPTLFV